MKKIERVTEKLLQYYWGCKYTISLWMGDERSIITKSSIVNFSVPYGLFSIFYWFDTTNEEYI